MEEMSNIGYVLKDWAKRLNGSLDHKDKNADVTAGGSDISASSTSSATTLAPEKTNNIAVDSNLFYNTTTGTITTTGGTVLGTTTLGSYKYYPNYYSTVQSVSGFNEVDTDIEAEISKIFLDEESRDRLIEEALNKDDEIYPIVERYLIKHLEKIMDNPDQIVKKIIEEKDETIKRLEVEVSELKEKVDKQEKVLEEIRMRQVFEGRRLYDDYGTYGDKIWWNTDKITCTYDSSYNQANSDTSSSTCTYTTYPNSTNSF